MLRDALLGRPESVSRRLTRVSECLSLRDARHSPRDAPERFAEQAGEQTKSPGDSHSPGFLASYAHEVEAVSARSIWRIEFRCHGFIAAHRSSVNPKRLRVIGSGSAASSAASPESGKAQKVQ